MEFRGATCKTRRNASCLATFSSKARKGGGGLDSGVRLESLPLTIVRCGWRCHSCTLIVVTDSVNYGLGLLTRAPSWSMIRCCRPAFNPTKRRGWVLSAVDRNEHEPRLPFNPEASESCFLFCSCLVVNLQIAAGKWQLRTGRSAKAVNNESPSRRTCISWSSPGYSILSNTPRESTEYESMLSGRLQFDPCFGPSVGSCPLLLFAGLARWEPVTGCVHFTGCPRRPSLRPEIEHGSSVQGLPRR